jgi:hypothetical protein
MAALMAACCICCIHIIIIAGGAGIGPIPKPGGIEPGIGIIGKLLGYPMAWPEGGPAGRLLAGVAVALAALAEFALFSAP